LARSGWHPGLGHVRASDRSLDDDLAPNHAQQRHSNAAAMGNMNRTVVQHKGSDAG